MEGMPRLPMLSVELKFCPVSSDFGEKLKGYISRVYQESGEAYAKEIEELNQLRENAVKSRADFSGCGIMKKYFAQLHLLRNRFPMEDKDEASIAFVWYEKFSDMPSPVTCEDIRYEMSCILHNIGASHSYLGHTDSRTTLDGLKVSCTHFQYAAWAFQTLRDDTPFHLSASSFSPDFSRFVLDWYAVLMLAQAQECILEKSLVDNRKAHIISKVAAQVSEYYAQCSRVLEEPNLNEVAGTSKCRGWRKFVDMKMHFYKSIAYYQLGVQADEEQKMGERLAYFQAASNELAEANRLAQKESPSVLQTLQFAHDVVNGRFNNAKKENDFVYHEKVPAVDTDLKGTSLVKGIPFDPLDPDISGPDIFHRLIPLDVHRASSMYSEEKAKVLRQIGDVVDSKNAALQVVIDSLKVDQLMLDTDVQHMPLPEMLIERCAAVNASQFNVMELLEKLATLTNLYSSADGVLSETNSQLQEIEKEMKTLVEIAYGRCDESKLPEDERAIFKSLTEFREELERYRRANQQATKSNGEIHKALNSHSANLQMLTLPLSELKRQLPAPSVEAASAPETLEMKKLLAKVDEMKAQRQTLMDKLRQQAREDDLTKSLLASKSQDPQELFVKELKKYEGPTSIIEQNLAAQENILKALIEANAKYAEVRQHVIAAISAREKKIMALVSAYDVCENLKSKAGEGVEFYEKLKLMLRDFQDKLTEWSDTQLQRSRERLRSLAERKAVSVSDTSNSATAAAAAAAQSGGPRLKDYMAYYRAKKAGQSAAFPSNAGGMVGDMNNLSLAASGLENQYVGLPQNGSAHTSTGSVPMSTYGAYGVQQMPSNSVSGYQPAGQTTAYGQPTLMDNYSQANVSQQNVATHYTNVAPTTTATGVSRHNMPYHPQQQQQHQPQPQQSTQYNNSWQGGIPAQPSAVSTAYSNAQAQPMHQQWPSQQQPTVAPTTQPRPQTTPYVQQTSYGITQAVQSMPMNTSYTPASSATGYMGQTGSVAPAMTGTRPALSVSGTTANPYQSNANGGVIYNSTMTSATNAMPANASYGLTSNMNTVPAVSSQQYQDIQATSGYASTQRPNTFLNGSYNGATPNPYVQPQQYANVPQPANAMVNQTYQTVHYGNNAAPQQHQQPYYQYAGVPPSSATGNYNTGNASFVSVFDAPVGDVLPPPLEPQKKPASSDHGLL